MSTACRDLAGLYLGVPLVDLVIVLYLGVLSFSGRYLWELCREEGVRGVRGELRGE